MNKYLVGVAGVAVLAFATTAKAADVMPVTVPTMVTPVVVAPPAPDVGIEIDAYATAYLFPFEIGVDLDISAHYIGVRGFGFRLEGGAGTSLFPSFSGGFGGDLQLFKQFGSLEVGVELDSGPLLIGPYVGYTFERGRLTVDGEIFFHFPFGPPPFLSAAADVTFDVNDKLELTAGFEFGGLVPLSAYVGASYAMGPVTPYVELDIGNGGPFSFIVGADFEKQIGTGPLSLIGNAEISTGMGTSASVSIGIRFSRGNT